MDPSHCFHDRYGKDGPWNSGEWSNRAFQELAVPIDCEIDAAKGKALGSQPGTPMGQKSPLRPVSWEKINDSWHNDVKGHHP